MSDSPFADGPIRESKECGVSANEMLVAEGWMRRHIIEPKRAEESAEMYREMGFEVRIEKLQKSDFGTACQGCGVTGCDDYVMIYTRRDSIDV
jgi:hypothetical protein